MYIMMYSLQRYDSTAAAHQLCGVVLLFSLMYIRIGLCAMTALLQRICIEQWCFCISLTHFEIGLVVHQHCRVVLLLDTVFR